MVVTGTARAWVIDPVLSAKSRIGSMGLVRLATGDKGRSTMQSEHRNLRSTTEDRMQAYCEAYGECGSVSKSVVIAGVNRETIRRWEQEDRHGFRLQVRNAQAVFCDRLESMALARCEDPTGNRGSDMLLVALNNANNPDKWRGNSMTVEVPDVVVSILTELQSQAKSIRAAIPSPGVVEGTIVPDSLPWD